MTPPRAPKSLSKQEAKQVFDEVLREWLDEMFAKFGRWSFFGGLATAFIFGVKSADWLKRHGII